MKRYKERLETLLKYGNTVYCGDDIDEFVACLEKEGFSVDVRLTREQKDHESDIASENEMGKRKKKRKKERVSYVVELKRR